MRLELHFLPTPAPDVAVVIDILRMTTTSTVLLSQGIEELVVLAEVDAARDYAAQTGALLCGERGGVKLAGFHGGNSPLEYLRPLSGSAVVCTSNGSRAVETCREAQHLLLGAIVNAAAVAERALELAETRISLQCAGTDGLVSLDDVLGAACIIRELAVRDPGVSLDDACRLALKVLQSGDTLAEGLLESLHGQRLHELGFDDDIAFAARLHRYRLVPQRSRHDPATFRGVMLD